MSSEWDEILKDEFGDYASEEHEDRWLGVTKDLERGDPVEGVVLAHSTFGVWVDIGLGFPALIEIIHIVNMTPEKYRKDDYYPPGSKIEAMIRSCTTRGHQIRLEQIAND
ncbi:hypothetical protein [Leucothrix arctica]|uniref:S1 motif domain-containing protein n=1 Tax=Leucothrix arctica TaxID=1481894 RepID=A0A317CDD8_9GAMM|nr:hypothetical protein [Leucothrix arctica]PWQ96407.1 hypothetical protein DKT75_10520 [Leucothrix arctica]